VFHVGLEMFGAPVLSIPELCLLLTAPSPMRPPHSGQFDMYIVSFLSVLVMLHHMVVNRSIAYVAFGATSVREFCIAPG